MGEEFKESVVVDDEPGVYRGWRTVGGGVADFVGASGFGFVCGDGGRVVWHPSDCRSTMESIALTLFFLP